MSENLGKIWQYITKTCLYNGDPLKLHFYVVKLRYTGYILFFLFLLKKHRIWVLIRTALEYRLAEAVLTSTHIQCFEKKYEIYQNFLSENLHFLVVKHSVYLNRLFS